MPNPSLILPSAGISVNSFSYPYSVVESGFFLVCLMAMKRPAEALPFFSPFGKPVAG